MIKTLHEIGVEVQKSSDRHLPGALSHVGDPDHSTLEVYASIKVSCRLYCEPDARDETIKAARLEVWQQLYGELKRELQPLWRDAMVNAADGKLQIVEEAFKHFDKLLTPQ